MGDTIIPYKIFEVAIITFKVTSLERSLQVLYCSFERNHQISCSAGGRDLPIYTAGLAGAMRVKFLAQGSNSNRNRQNWAWNLGPCTHQTNAWTLAPGLWELYIIALNSTHSTSSCSEATVYSMRNFNSQKIRLPILSVNQWLILACIRVITVVCRVKKILQV